MSKVKVILKINDYLIEEKAIIKDSILLLKDKDNLKTNIKIDLIKNTIIRENKEMLIEINFVNKIINYHIKELNKSFTSPFEILNLEKKEEQLKIKYKIENNIFNLFLEYKEEKNERGN